MFEKALRLGLRFQTTKGNLPTEDLWALSLPQLNELAKSLKKALKLQEDVEDYLQDTSEEDTITQLKFDIVLHILNTLKAEKKQRDSINELNKEEQELLAIAALQKSEELRNNPEKVKQRLAEIANQKKGLK